MREPLNDGIRINLMLEAIANIEQFMAGGPSYEEFTANKLLCHAVIYNLQCIGESAYKLSREYVQAHPEEDWEAIEGLRHVLVHDYYAVDMSTIGAILESDLPKLKAYLEGR